METSLCWFVVRCAALAWSGWPHRQQDLGDLWPCLSFVWFRNERRGVPAKTAPAWLARSDHEEPPTHTGAACQCVAWEPHVHSGKQSNIIDRSWRPTSGPQCIHLTRRQMSSNCAKLHVWTHHSSQKIRNTPEHGMASEPRHP